MEVPYSTVKVDEDIVYSPNKYRETEGAKEIELKVWSHDQCLENG
jgi:hypothetical protein